MTSHMLLCYSKLQERCSYCQACRWAPGILILPNNISGVEGSCFLLQQSSHLVVCAANRAGFWWYVVYTICLLLVKKVKLPTNILAAHLERFSCFVLFICSTGIKKLISWIPMRRRLLMQKRYK